MRTADRAPGNPARAARKHLWRTYIRSAEHCTELLAACQIALTDEPQAIASAMADKNDVTDCCAEPIPMLDELSESPHIDDVEDVVRQQQAHEVRHGLGQRVEQHSLGGDVTDANDEKAEIVAVHELARDTNRASVDTVNDHLRGAVRPHTRLDVFGDLPLWV